MSSSLKRLALAEKKDEHEEMATFAEIATKIVFVKRDGFGYDLQEEGEEGHDQS